METDDAARHADIEARAYTLWMESGQPEGRAEDFWHLAKAQIDSEAVGVAGDWQGQGQGMMLPAAEPDR